MDTDFVQYSDDPEVQQSMVHLFVMVEIAQKVRINFLEHLNRMSSLIMAILLRAR